MIAYRQDRRLIQHQHFESSAANAAATEAALKQLNLQNIPWALIH